MRSTLLFLGLLAAGAVSAAGARVPLSAANDDPSCLDLPDHDACLDAGCAWCASDLLGDKCVAAAVGKLVPSTLATCDLPPEPERSANDDPAPSGGGGSDPPKPPAAVSCGDNKSKRDCLDDGAQEGDCAWCEGDFMPASCVGLKAAEWIPETVAKCKMPKKHDAPKDALGKPKKHCGKHAKKHDDDDDDDDDDDLPATCADVKERKPCVKHGSQEGPCFWCKGGFMPAGCMAEMAAKYIPESVAGKCEAPRKKSKQAASKVASEVEKKRDDDDDDLPATCDDVKERKACVKYGSQAGACAWCKGGYMPAGCVDAVKAKFLPEQVAGKCDAGKKGEQGAQLAPEGQSLLARVFGALAGGSSGGGFDPSHWIPGSGKKDKKGGDSPSPWGPPGGGGAGGSCMDYKDKKACLKGKGTQGGCAWCDQKFMGKSCMDEGTAKFLPAQVAECKFPKKKDKKDDDALVLPATS